MSGRKAAISAHTSSIGAGENDNAVKLAASLEYEADKLLADADLLLDERTADACSLSHYNAPDDLIVMAP